MKFNEKLIELRKKEGLSQEELGFKLNVTRQTVSKWELGQTTPDMDKLTEISKLFNVSVDELINESETVYTKNSVIEDQPIGNEEPKRNKVVIAIVVALLVVLVFIVVKVTTAFTTSNNEKGNTRESFFDKVFGVLDKAVDVQENIMEKYNEYENEDEFSNEIFGDVKNIIGNSMNEMNITKFNGALEIYAGNNIGASIISVLDDIITSNKTEDRIIVVKYMETETQNEDEIKNIKYSIENFDNYDLTFEYDADGFICKAIIEKI